MSMLRELENLESRENVAPFAIKIPLCACHLPLAVNDISHVAALPRPQPASR